MNGSAAAVRSVMFLRLMIIVWEDCGELQAIEAIQS